MKFINLPEDAYSMAISAATFAGALTYQLMERQQGEKDEKAILSIEEDLSTLNGIRVKLMLGAFNMVRTMSNNLRTNHPYKNLIYNEACEIVSMLEEIDEVQGEDN